MAKGSNISIGRIQATKFKYERAGYVWYKSGKSLAGEIAFGRQVGKDGSSIVIWSVCPNCGFERWVRSVKNYGRKCAACVGREYASAHVMSKAVGWCGGRSIVSGYVSVLLPKDSPYLPMAVKHKQVGYLGYRILEHRLVMARYLGRLLKKWEVVHHINGIKTDNRLENLELLPNSHEHMGYTLMQNRIKSLEARVTILESENILLETQIQEFKDDRIRRL